MDSTNTVAARRAVEEATAREDRAALLQALRHLARTLEANGEVEEAGQIYEQVIQLDPSDGVALRILGRTPPPPLQGEPHRIASAPAELHAEEGLSPEVQASLDLGVSYAEMELYDEALTQFEAVLRLGPLPRFVAQRLIQTLDPLLATAHAQGRPEDERLRIGYLLGLSQEALGNCRSAQEFYHAVASLDPLYKDVAQRLRTNDR